MSNLARRMARVGPSAIMELIKTLGAGGYISFASGLPDPALFPRDELRDIALEVLTRDGGPALQYGAAEGYSPLRERVATILTGRGLPTAPEQVLITSGSQQGLDLAARALLDPGDLVALEAPTYLAALQVFDCHEAGYLALGMDDEGLVPDRLSTQAASPVRMLYVLPNFQNPTGLTLAPWRRRHLAELAAERRWALVEDDAYHDLRFEGEPEPPVCALADNPLAVYLGTFSKTIAPGLRVGYVRAGTSLIERLAQLKQITDLHTSSLSQRMVEQYCGRGLLRPGIQRFVTAYRDRRDALLLALERELGGVARWTRPAGGMFVFVTLPDALDACTLLERCLARGVAFVPGSSFFPAGGGENTLRLNFVSVGAGQIREGVRILAEEVRAGR